MNKDDIYCFRLLKEGDRNRYLSVLFAPKKCRSALASLYAFNIEVSRIAETVHQPMIGEIRLRWWRDAIDGEKAGSGNPVLNALLATIDQFDLPKAALLRYCDARVFDLYNDPMPDITALEGYCGETASTLLQLSCQMLDSNAARLATDVSGHGGVAQALCGLLRSLPIIKARGQCYFPSHMGDHSPNDFLVSPQVSSGKFQEKLLSPVIALARQHYRKFYEDYRKLPDSLKPAFLSLAIVPEALGKIENKGESAFDQCVNLSPLRRYFLITKAAITGRMPPV